MHEFLARVWRGLVAHVDAPLLLITLTLMAVGLTTVYSATYDANSHLLAQMLNMAIGLCAMWTVAQVPPQKLMRFGVPLYLVGVVLLILVFFSGSRSMVPGAGCRSDSPAYSPPKSSR
jgi:Bacterial cell division membrane protein